MDLGSLLSDILLVAKEQETSTPYIVGGVVRDKLLGNLLDIKDVDLTTGDNTILYLAKGFFEKYSKSGASFKKMKDGHIRIFYKNIQLDFSSNFRVPGIEYYLQKGGIQKPTIMQKELFSRDFTCNAALMTLDLENILDPIGRSVSDIQKNTLKTCLSPKLTLGYMPRRILRLINLMVRLHFDVDLELKNYIKNNTNLIDCIEPEYLATKLGESLLTDKALTIDIIKEIGLYNKFKSVPSVTDFI